MSQDFESFVKEFWQTGRLDLAKRSKIDRAKREFSMKYRRFYSPDHPLLGAIYQRMRQLYSDMYLSLKSVANGEHLHVEAREARRKARLLTSLMWPFVQSEMNHLRKLQDKIPA